ncbi:EAL domain-containing protein [Sphingomonas sp.]|uniref:putative bifunctional diguanylate cyclase/phosphodiesterase n=1 Tax=Sphingomonas sp. TaxID=28214 RepID=UPI001E17DEC4|nr:EAL domain-containing protein [Sphingomonas sp.]MBX9796670.1 EAL domain-containing protein [Sphingomonas sp.]
MHAASLKSRAIMFALLAGMVAFVLALAATYDGSLSWMGLSNALIPAIICATLCWASAQRQLSTVAAAIDAAVDRIKSASEGDLEGPTPPEIGQHIPQLGSAMERLFAQIGANLESVHRLALFDSVTGLPNRTHFRRSCERMLSGLPPGQHAALLFIDLDRFKIVNDTMGHAMGDMLLGMVANRLRAVSERLCTDNALAAPLIGRLAGDEFTIFFPDVLVPELAGRIGRGVLYALSEPFDLNGNEVEIGASIGIALRPDHGTSLTDLMRAADAAMYHAKERGRGRVEYFTEALAAELADRAQLENDLREAIERDQFALVFQPQISSTDGRMVVAEALLRWAHPRFGLKLPGSFIKRAEETGMIVEIGDWVIDTVAGTISRWHAAGHTHRLAINVSPRQIDHAGFFRRLREALRAAGAPARLLELEITETMAMHCGEETLNAIAALRADGATIAIDDFGTGYSNLARLRDLPVDRVKIDRSLVEHIATKAQARTIVQAVIGLIHGLDCEAVAEGVETEAQAEVLRVIGCDVIQGYAIAQPMAEAALMQWAQTPVRAAAG